MASRRVTVERPAGLIAVVVLMCFGVALLALGSLVFFTLGQNAVTAQPGGPMSQLFLKMGTAGAGVFLALSVVYGTLALLMWRLVYWARLGTVVFITLGLLLALLGILLSLPHPDILVLAWQLFVIVVDAWILRYVAHPNVQALFAARRYHQGVRVEAGT